MRGQILGVDVRTGDGMVAGDDGRRYSFTPTDWAHRGEPAVGMQVDFETEQSRALSIFPVPGTLARHKARPRPAGSGLTPTATGISPRFSLSCSGRWGSTASTLGGPVRPSPCSS
jgi:hypothetical protein